MSFVHAIDGQLVDGSSQPLLLRGIGLGNWLLPEGYMWKLPAKVDSPRRIEAMITDLVGTEQAREFWARFHDQFLTEADIARIAAEGFDHVRLAINSRVLLDDDGFALVDKLIGWCRTHRLWVILDLHGAPGGQTGTNIDDSPNLRPELFEHPHYRAMTIDLWTMIAQRYRDEPVVAGYDLLNEPLPNEYQYTYADRLADLYRDLTTAIRAVDPNHLIIYEGSQWSTNWSIFTEVWDSNSMLQFHKYWSPPDLPSIKQYLDIGAKLGLPIYMGEGGENNLDWIQTAFQLYSDHRISWNFWPWKKVDTQTSPCSIDRPTGWDTIVAFAAGGAKPSADTAWEVLSELLDNMLIDRCTYRPEVVNAMLRRAPLRLPASGFTFHGEGRSYGTSGAQPLTGFRSDDKVTLRPEPVFDQRCTDNHVLADLNTGDWLEYEINVTSPAVLEFTVDSTKSPRLDLDGAPVPAGPVAPGQHFLRVTATSDETTLASITVTTDDSAKSDY